MTNYLDTNGPYLVSLKWKDCEKEPPKHEDYYVIKYDQKRYMWFLSYYSLEKKEWLCLGSDFVWFKRDPQPWKWAELPKLKHDKSLFDL